MSSGEEMRQFRRLIAEVEKTYRAVNPACRTPIQEWKGAEITDFQEDLLEKVQGRISEKWFYTHIRQEQDKMPRIDILNLLSEYVGYKSWQEFCHEGLRSAAGVSHSAEAPVSPDGSPVAAPAPKGRSSLRKLAVPGVIVVLVALVATWLIAASTPSSYTFCFIDADTQEKIEGQVEVSVLWENESPQIILADSNGCITIETGASQVKFKVKSPYYHPETISRSLDKMQPNEKIQLNADDYALMVHFFSTSRIEDWKKRRAQLEEMFAENAEIIQVSSQRGLGMEMFNKQEFINRMTLPVKSLKNVEVIDTEYSAGKIVKLRFKLNTEK